MELIYFFIALGIFAIGAGIWGYWDYHKGVKESL
jgi:hypothetical protein